MSTTTFRLFFVTVGMLLALGLSKLIEVDLYKIASVVGFLVALDHAARSLIVEIIMSQNVGLVEKITKTIEDAKNDREIK